jgi:hypothetical protein
VSDLDGMESGEALAVYDQVVTFLKEGCEWVQRWRTWQGEEDDARAWSEGDCPGLQLLPQFADDGWQDEGSFKGKLVIGAELALTSHDVREAARFWRSMKRVFYPEDRTVRETIRLAISEAAGGYAPGYVEFRGLSFQPPTSGGVFLARGQLVVLVNELLNP